MMVGVNIGYLICKDCKGYYELEEGEHPEDFESCHCGGELLHTKHFDNLVTIMAFADMDEEQQKKFNEILNLEQAMQNRTNPYYGNNQHLSSLLDKVSDSFTRDIKQSK